MKDEDKVLDCHITFEDGMVASAVVRLDHDNGSAVGLVLIVVLSDDCVVGVEQLAPSKPS